MQIENSAHLGHSVELNKKRRGMKLARLTAGGISTAVAMKTQITSFRKEDISISQNNYDRRENVHHTCFQRNWTRPNVAEP